MEKRSLDLCKCPPPIYFEGAPRSEPLEVRWRGTEGSGGPKKMTADSTRVPGRTPRA